MDPSSALLLRNGGRVPEKEKLDSGRYTIRPSEPPMPPKVAAPKPQPAVAPNAPASVVAGQPVEPTTAVVASPASSPITSQMQELVLGGSPEEIDLYRDRLHPEDTRNNLVELTLAPGYVYTNAASNYWFREYYSSAPVLMIGAQIWVTPFFGINTSITNSMNASIDSTTATDNRISLDQQWLDAGFRWRSFYGVSRKAPVMSFGLDFSEYTVRVPSSATQRVGTKTNGAKLSWEAMIPGGNSFAWQFGGFIIPRADHNENKSALTLKSGTSDESTVIGLWLGGNHTFDRRSQLFWRIQHSVEKNTFEGAASTADPVTGATPTGVSVTTGTTMFTFGYRWGN